MDNRVIRAGSISALNFQSKEEYWTEHTRLIQDTQKQYKKELIVVIEDYLLYATKAKDQINSRMETPKVIGIMQLFCFNKNIPYWMQNASDVKNRWTNEILHYKNYITMHKRNYVIPNSKEKIDRHCLDSIRHAVHFANFKNKEVS